MEVLIEQITLANKNRFGRSSEKMTDTSQICFIEVDGTIVFFNEAEAVSDLDAEEPDTLENKPARKAITSFPFVFCGIDFSVSPKTYYCLY